MAPEIPQIPWQEKIRQALSSVKLEIENQFSDEERTFRERYDWDWPDVGKRELLAPLEDLLLLIETHNFQGKAPDDEDVARCIEKLESWKSHCSGEFRRSSERTTTMCFSFLVVIDCVRRVLEKGCLESNVKNVQALVKQDKQRAEALNKRLEACADGIGEIEAAAKRILDADKAAQMLPETQESLKQAHNEARGARDQAIKDADEIKRLKQEADSNEKALVDHTTKADNVLKKCQSVLASVTSTGLAQAFYKRKNELQWIGLAWSVALLVALIAAVVCIVWRTDQIFDLINKNTQISGVVLFANFVISIAFVGAPIWLAWVATKQVGYYFRLSEDYAFKATVSASYEGFRREAENQGDEELTKKVLSSTLDRYDEAPLRFVDTRVSGSPYQELMESPIVSKFLKTAPDAVKAIQEFAQEKLEKVAGKTAEKVVDAAEKALVEK